MKSIYGEYHLNQEVVNIEDFGILEGQGAVYVLDGKNEKTLTTSKKEAVEAKIANKPWDRVTTRPIDFEILEQVAVSFQADEGTVNLESILQKVKDYTESEVVSFSRSVVLGIVLDNFYEKNKEELLDCAEEVLDEYGNDYEGEVAYFAYDTNNEEVVITSSPDHYLFTFAKYNPERKIIEEIR